VPKLFEAGRDWDVYVARVDGTVAAALLLFYFGGTVEYFTPAVEVRFRQLQPLAAVLDRALADAAERGLARWNWGGTWLTQTSLHRFKRKWGAEEAEYRYHTQLNDRSLLEATPEELRERFPHFFVVPFAALRQPSAAGV
jgi:lipid II:glycine glycyltransferase (peptidoglycan interpeptide bridge formation enzyme)